MANTDQRKSGPMRPELLNREAERAVLSAALADPSLLIDLTTEIDSIDFGDEGHQAIWDALVAVDGMGRGVDVITVADQLRRDKMLDRAGGTAALDQLLDSAVPTGHLAGWVQIVQERSRLRRTFQTAAKIASECLAPDADPLQVLGDAEAAMMSVARGRSAESLVGMAQAVADTKKQIEAAKSRALVGVSTGFKRLDELTHGLQPGQLIILAARPAMGKSSLAMNIATNVAEATDQPVYVASYEMSYQELTMRLLSTYSGVSLSDLKSGRIPRELASDFERQAEKVAGLSLLVNSRPPSTVGQLRSELRRVARRGPLGCIVIDYLQLMTGELRRNSDSRAQEVSEISRGLKELAMELRVPVIALSQLNRGVESRQDKRPMLSDLRESGSLEQDADTVWMLYRHFQYDASADPAMAELNIVKQRSGPTGTVVLDFDGACQRWSNSTKAAIPAMGGSPGGPRGGGPRGGGSVF